MINKQHSTNAPARCIVSPGSFFSTNAEKTKLNWFLFEYAQEIESTIRRTKQLKKLLLRKGVDDSRIADFCVHYSKHMKEQILDTLAGQIPTVEIGYEEIEVFFPEIGDRLVNQVLEVVANAWDSQTKECVTCQTRCISERNKLAPMFDEAYYWE
jgi:hypothetical protein